MRNLITTTLLFAALLLLPAGVSAYSITVSNYDALSGVDFTASGGSLTTSAVAGVTGLGVSGGVSGEIGIGQSITIDFAEAQYVNTLNLAQLYTAGNYGDAKDEVASITVLGDFGSQTFYLTASEATVANWTGFGTVLNLDPAVAGSGALWQLVNPFGNLAIYSIVLTAADSFAGAGSTNSDYGFHSMETTTTPIPGAVWLLGSGLFGLVGLRRRTRS
ncbi:MAG: VPLPA-CTERM sorting domain-containing protein [Desulfovibrio sp.]